MPSGKPNRTTVVKSPFFDPAQGTWKFLPTDLTCRQTIQEPNENGEVGQPVNVYESREKGLIPVRFASEEQIRLLPENWRDIAHAGAGLAPKPVFADAGK